MDRQFEHLHVHLDRIEEQTKKTNGRVSALENHRAYLWGAYSILVLLSGLILHFAVKAIDDKIDKKVVEKFSTYEIDK